MDGASPLTGSAGKPAKPVVRGKGKGKALNAIAAASGRDPAAIVKSVTEAEAAAKAAAARAKAEEEAKEAEEARKAREEVTAAQIFGSLSSEQQYRFECFRRCGFASKPMEKFVAKMLVEEAEKRYLARRGAMVGLGGALSGGDGYVYDDAPQNITAAVTDTSDADSKKSNAQKKRKRQSKKHIVREESKRRRAAMDQPQPYFLGGNNGIFNSRSGSEGSGTSHQAPPLDNLVVPDSASEIVAVVSTLAKCYGQRLVAAAKRVADAEEEEKNIDETSATDVSLPTTPKPLRPHHFLEAHRHRARAGMDPGFWMADRIGGGKRESVYTKGGVGVAEAAALGTVDRDRACYLAALAAQDVCDSNNAGKEEEGPPSKDVKIEMEED